jgi:plastocyanin
MILALALALAVCGCGESSARYSSSVLRLRIGEYEISPESVQMRAGDVRIRLTNDGVLVHEVAIADSDGKIVGQTGAVFPGHTVTSAAFRLVPGRYRVYDPGANYADLGAYGALAVSGRRRLPRLASLRAALTIGHLCSSSARTSLRCQRLGVAAALPRIAGGPTT